jgi:hypothetical protein
MEKIISPNITFEMFGITFNVLGISITLLIIAILMLFYRIQRDKTLDFADMLTADGRKTSLTKVLQLVGGMTATWIVIALTLSGGLNEALFGIYLAYVASVEGFSKFVAARYGYQEKSTRSVKQDSEEK